MNHRRPHPGFTLIELLVVVAIIALLMGILLPTLGQVRRIAQRAVCAVSAKGLVQANAFYAADHGDHYVLAAEDMLTDLGDGHGGRYRWHGSREAADEAFNPGRGPLREYVGAKQRICATFTHMEDQFGGEQFERGAGGYGYNANYIGGRYDLYDATNWTSPHFGEPYKVSARTMDVTRPATTVMFADAAMVQAEGTAVRYIEYSFSEPPFHVQPGSTLGRTWPSTHFRHLGQANVGWADGHVSAEEMTNSAAEYGVPKSQVEAHHIGWFGPDSNELFDLE